MYIVSALLQNALTCLYGNNTSTFFDLDPPKLEEYLSQLNQRKVYFFSNRTAFTLKREHVKIVSGNCIKKEFNKTVRFLTKYQISM